MQLLLKGYKEVLKGSQLNAMLTIEYCQFYLFCMLSNIWDLGGCLQDGNYYCSVLFKREIFIQMRAAFYASFLSPKKRGNRERMGASW